MTEPASPRLSYGLTLLGAATATGLWAAALLLYAAMPDGGGAPTLAWDHLLLGYLASVVVFGGLGWFLGVASR